MAYRGERAGDRGAGPVQSTVRRGPAAAREPWWAANRAIRFYGVVLLAGTKAADAVTTAVGLSYLSGIVELNPVANAVFAGNGTLTGLILLSFATVLFGVLSAELLAVELRRRLELYRPALVVQATIYGSLAALFGAVAVHNAVLLIQRTVAILGEVFFL